MGVQAITDRATLAPLFMGWQENLVQAALDGCMGQVFANESLTAARIENGDFVFLAGDASCEEAEALVTGNKPISGPETAIYAAKEPAWYPVIERVHHGRATRCERYAIRKDRHRFDPDTLRTYAATLPDGVLLRPIDGELYRLAMAEHWSRDLVSQFLNEADYAARGLGVAAVRGREPLAGASSYVVFRGGLEVEIDTRSDMRRQGLATACGAALILRCLERGLYPSWDAASRASVMLAEKLGYFEDHAYPVYRVVK